MYQVPAIECRHPRHAINGVICYSMARSDAEREASLRARALKTICFQHICFIDDMLKKRCLADPRALKTMVKWKLSQTSRHDTFRSTLSHSDTANKNTGKVVCR
eukprot:6213816-Pleurochrysis_carterae.AAC.3